MEAVMLGEPNPWIIDVTLENFEPEVVEKSRSVPVLLDFWAPWCAPCRELSPLLERLVREQNGNILLAKVNVDENQQIASWFGVQSIPVVFLLKDAQAVDQFMGLMPEAQLREWIQRFLPSPLDRKYAAAQAAEATSPATAEALYREILPEVKDGDPIWIALARTLLAQHRDDEARAIITDLERRGFLEPEAKNLLAELDLRKAALESGGVGQARAAVAADPENLQLRLQLADALAAGHQYPEALDLCLDLIRNHKAAIGDAAKATMVQIFQVMGNQSELVQQYRRRLATAFY